MRLAHFPGIAAELESHRRRDELVRQVRDALAHVHDLPYLQTHPLARPAPSAGAGVAGRALQQELLEAVEALGAAGRAGRTHQVLVLRYVETLAPSQVWQQLGVSKGEYYREHACALGAVASVLQERRARGEHAPIGPPRPRAAARLPSAASSFVGRADEVAEVKRLLETTRLLTLTGPGGCGKTRLALHAAAELGSAFPDGVHLADLALLTDPASVPGTVAAAVGVGAAPSEPIVEALLAGLEDRRCLLVLDNCEHVVGVSAELVDAVLRACPDVRVLATSREPLRVAGEVRWRVPPLAVPPEEALPPERVRAYPAVALFVDRAASVAPGFHLTEENTAAVAGVCRRLDGIPLAIELAAARVGVLPVEQLTRRLDDPFRLLTDGSRTAPLRQQTLRASLDWSHDLLSELERVLLRRLAVFAGGFCLEAAETVCAGDGLAVADVLGVLTQLVQKSLVQADHVDGTGQYRLLETVRHYASKRLAEAGEEARVRDRHAACFARLTAEAGPPHGPGRSRWLERFDREHDNLEAALRWAHVCGDVETSRRLVAALAELLVEPRPSFDERVGTGLSPHRVQITDQVLRSALARAARWGGAAPGAAPLVEVPCVASGGTHPLSLAVPERHSHEPPFAALLTAGRRIGKALALRWQAVDLGAGWLAVRHTLGNLPAHPRRLAEAGTAEELDRARVDHPARGALAAGLAAHSKPVSDREASATAPV